MGYAYYVPVVLPIRVSAILAGSAGSSRVKDQCVSCQFKVVVRFERCCDRWYLTHEDVFQMGVGAVGGRDQQKLVWSMEQQKGIDEIRVFGHYHPRVSGREFVDLGVGSTIAVGQVERVEHVVACVAQPVGHPAGKLRVNQEVHARVGSVRLTWLNRVA